MQEHIGQSPALHLRENEEQIGQSCCAFMGETMQDKNGQDLVFDLREKYCRRTLG